MLKRYLVAIALLASVCSLAQAADDTCIFFSAENLAQGPGNWYLYVPFSDVHYKIEKGDALEYDIYLPETNPVMKGGFDVYIDGPHLRTPALRESKLKDQNGIRFHGDGLLDQARGKWYHRTFDLAEFVGATTTRWELVFEGDEDGRYAQFIDNIHITRAGQTVQDVYSNGPVNVAPGGGHQGYSQKFSVVTVKRDEVGDQQFMSRLYEIAEERRKLRAARDSFHAELDMVDELAKQRNDPHMQGHLQEARDAEDVAAYERGDAEAYTRSLHAARGRLTHEHKAMTAYTGHLVGHAHIDLAWLWTWDDTINNTIPHTFGQAIKFMDEFPTFTFSQSSATLYQATQVFHPDLFKKIMQRVADGRWEIVGGRWCEGDTNMISPESHVRQFLYGQRYFETHFGKRATVGWEPDTFGHCWTMPQILRKAGIDSYYFCRGGKGHPLFWWEAPDGSRVLAFEEPATGGWYNDDVSDEKVKELIRFALKTGTQDELMVYGVGNHGGGPTREYIEAALAMKDHAGWPAIKFSTATAFFDLLHKMEDKLTIPTVKTDLNPIFNGCYTSQSEIKRLNRKSEAALESAEVFATLAHEVDAHSTYPQAQFAALWQDVLWGHHHDTLPGSCIHPAALYARELLGQAVTDAEVLSARATQALAAPHKNGIIVFNPTAAPRSDVVQVDVSAARVTSGREAMNLQRGERGTYFVAHDVPPLGYKVFGVEVAQDAPPVDVLPFQQADIPGSTGTGEPTGPAATAHRSDLTPVFQILHEKPGSGTAWTIQEIDKTETLDKPVFTQVLEDGPVCSRVRRIYTWGRSTISAEEIRYAHTPRVDYDINVDWIEIGNHTDGSPLLKFVVPTGLADGTATAQIPFADIERPKDGKEYPMLEWVDVSSAQRGVTVLNDCKYGYDVQPDGAIRVTLLRASYDPDPTPDVGPHHIRMAVLPHDGPLDKAQAVAEGEALNKPLRAVCHLDADAKAVTGQPTELSACTVDAPNIVVTAVKRAEDGNGVIVRAYECAGKKVTAKFDLGFDTTSAKEVDLIEHDMRPSAPLEHRKRSIQTTFAPYEIRTFLLATP